MSAPARNPHEEAARYRKVQAFVGAIDLLAVEKGVAPIRNPLEVVRRIKLMPPAWWAVMAERAGCKAPSDPTPRGQTVRAIVGVYCERAATSKRRSA